MLSGRPIGAPILLADGDDLPSVTDDVLNRLKPKGSDLSKDAQVIRVGAGTARPEGFKTALIEGDDPFQAAAAIDRFFSAARASPSNDVVLYSADRGEFAMPAAAWAARSGDAVLPVRRNAIPAPIVKALREHERPNVFVLGPESVISEASGRPAEEAQARAGGEPDRGAERRRERDRVRPLREGRLRLGRGRAGLQLHDCEHHAALRRRRRRRARHARGLRPATAQRRRRRSSRRSSRSTC